jgi:RNA polymerase sigma factor (sigma-70 family)
MQPMARAPAGSILRHIHLLVETHSEQSDAQLLQRFAVGHEEEAFTVLMRRHGQMVWGVCRHVLRFEHDAEDAFQATFLVLARRAASIRKGESVGSWLHGVANRIAVRAKRSATRRKEQERLARSLAGARPGEGATPPLPVDLAVRELQAMLDEEVARLSAKWRAPFILCCLEGRSRAETAVELGWKEGTVSSRIAEARRLLQRRLARRGVTLSAALTAGVLGNETASAALVATTRQAALFVVAGRSMAEVASPSVAELAAGGIRSLAGVRGKIALVMLLAGLGGAGLLAGFRPPAAGSDPPGHASDARTDSRTPMNDPVGDPLPAGVLTRVASGRMRHNDRLRAMVVSPNGKLLATGGANRLRLWDTATGKLKRQFGVDSNWGQRMTFSPDSSILISVDGYHDLTCRRLDLRTGKELSRFYLDLDADGELSSDGTLMVVVEDRKTASLYDTASGRKTGAFSIDVDGRVAVRPDGKALAVTHAKNSTIRIYEIPTGNLLIQISQPGNAFIQVVYSHDGRWLATNSVGGEDAIRIWDSDTGKERLRLKGSRGYHVEFRFSPNGKLLAAAGPESPDFALWELSTGKQLRRVTLASQPRRVQFSPDSKTLFTECRDGAILAWDVASGKTLPISADPVMAVRELRFDASGKRLIGIADRFRAWDALSGREVRAYPQTTGLSALSPDGNILASSTDDGMIRLVNATTGKEVRAWKAHDRTLWALVFSADGKRLYSAGGWEPKIRVWDVATARCAAEMGGYRDGIMQLALSPDGRFLVSSGNHAVEACDLRLWDLQTGREVRRFPVHLQMKHHPVFSPDSRWLAAATSRPGVAKTGGEVQVWEVATGRRLHILAGHKQPVIALAFSTDSRVLATGSVDQTVRLWDLAGGRERKRLLGHEGSILSLAFAPDDRRLAASSPDAPVYLWDVAAVTRRALPGGALSPAQQEALWQELGNDDPSKAYPAVVALAAAPRQAVHLLGRNLQPVPLADAGLMKKTMADLESDDFAIRQKASAVLEKLGESALAAMRDELARNPSPEAARRLKALLNRADNTELSGALLRAVRAVAVLEQIGTPEAKQLLRKLAKGALEARLTGEAKGVLERLGRR